MVDIKTAYEQVLLESKANRLRHLFDDGTMTFDDFRTTFKNVFKGKVGMSSNVKKFPVYITFKDGQFAFANDKNTVKEPYSIDKVC